MTGLLHCGTCGGGFAAVGRDYLACSAARKLGSCRQRMSIRRAVLEEAVLQLLKDRLMQPEAVAQFIKAVGNETNAGSGTASARTAQLQSERAAVARKLEGLYDAIADGLRTAGLRTRVETLETRLAEIDDAFSAAAPSPVWLHPNLSDLYRREVTELAAILSDPDAGSGDHPRSNHVSNGACHGGGRHAGA